MGNDGWDISPIRTWNNLSDSFDLTTIRDTRDIPIGRKRDMIQEISNVENCSIRTLAYL